MLCVLFDDVDLQRGYGRKNQWLTKLLSSETPTHVEAKGRWTFGKQAGTAHVMELFIRRFSNAMSFSWVPENTIFLHMPHGLVDKRKKYVGM